MLSTKAGIPIAKIVGNPHYHSINLVLPDDPDLHLPSYIRNEDYDAVSQMTDEELENVVALLTKKSNNRLAITSLIAKTQATIAANFAIDDGKLEPTVNFRNERDVLYVFGPSGSGKSHYIGTYIGNYHHTFPDNNIIIFSAVQEDRAFDVYNPIRIRLNHLMGSEELNLVSPEVLDKSLFEDSLVIFDDIDTISNSSVRGDVIKIRDDLLETGRHLRASVAATSHVALDREKTKRMINESHFITFFPRSGQHRAATTFMKEYIGASPQQIKKILELPSRWVTIYKNYPQYVFYERGAFLTSIVNPHEVKLLKERIHHASLSLH